MPPLPISRSRRYLPATRSPACTSAPMPARGYRGTPAAHRPGTGRDRFSREEGRPGGGPPRSEFLEKLSGLTRAGAVIAAVIAARAVVISGAVVAGAVVAAVIARAAVVGSTVIAGIVGAVPVVVGKVEAVA